MSRATPPRPPVSTSAIGPAASTPTSSNGNESDASVSAYAATSWPSAGRRRARASGGSTVDANRVGREHQHDKDPVGGEEAVCVRSTPELAREHDPDGGRQTGLHGERDGGHGAAARASQSGRVGRLGHRRESVRLMTTDTSGPIATLDELRREFGDVYGGRTVLVTGADGFMGSHLTDALVELGANVHAFVRATSSGALNNIGHLRNRLKVHFADLTDKTSIDYLIRELEETRRTGRTSSTSAPRRTSASRGTGRTRR